MELVAKLARATGVFFGGGDQGRIMDVLKDEALLQIKRQRENRLFGLVLKHPGERGVGIDEGAALLVEGDEAEVVGGAVMLVDARPEPGTLLVTLVPPGRRIDLRPPRP